MDGRLKEKLEAQERRLKDKYVESAYVYWSALLTINGLLLGLFSPRAASPDLYTRIVTYILVISCVISCWLLLYNFRAFYGLYYTLGRTSSLPTQEEKEEMDDEIDRKHTWRRRRETTVEGLLVLETALVAVLLFL